MKTSELTGVALDWAVAKCAGVEIIEDYSLKSYPLLIVPGEEHIVDDGYAGYSPSTDWAIGGPLIEREGIDVVFRPGDKLPGFWDAYGPGTPHGFSAPTPLVAAMRCFCASKLGDEVTIPEE